MATPHELNAPTHGTISFSKDGHFPKEVTITPTISHPTDIWRKPGPPEVSTFNAPALYRKVELGKFRSVRVKVTAKWNTLYDQGGLVFVFPSTSTGTEEEIGKKSRWIKTGIEFYNEQSLVSTVARDQWADWSLYPDGVFTTSSTQGVELLVEKVEKDNTLWVFVIKDGKKLPIREITWVGEEEVGREVWVGVFAATPEGFKSAEKEGRKREGLEVRFEGLEWDIRE